MEKFYEWLDKQIEIYGIINKSNRFEADGFIVNSLVGNAYDKKILLSYHKCDICYLLDKLGISYIVDHYDDYSDGQEADILSFYYNDYIFYMFIKSGGGEFTKKG